jgi:Fic family protein
MRADSEFAKRGGKPGELRKKVVWIGGGGNIATSRFNPPPPNDVLGCLVDQLDYLRCDGMQQLHQSIITQMAIAHAHFEAIHPFQDGNGRVGRLLLPLMLAVSGHTPLYLSPYIAMNKAEYIEALVAAQQRLEYEPLIGHLSRAVVSIVADADNALNRLNKLSADWRLRRKFRKGSAAQRMLEELLGHPVVTGKTVVRLLKISRKPAYDCLKQLEDIKILRERTGNKRNKVFVADEVLNIFQNPSMYEEEKN